VAGRLEYVTFGAHRRGTRIRNPRTDHLLANGERVVTGGATCVHDAVDKVQVNVIREIFKDALRTPVPGRTGFSSVVTRLQIVL